MSLEERTWAPTPALRRWASDPNRMLPGEVPETTSLDDAQHWVRVYRDMLTFTERVTAAEAGLAPSQPPEGGDLPDPALLRAHVDRLAFRLRFWEARVKQLAAESDQPARP